MKQRNTFSRRIRFTAMMLAAMLFLMHTAPVDALATAGSKQISLENMMYARRSDTELTATVYADGFVRRVVSDASTVAGVLRDAGISLGADDMTEPALSEEAYHNMTITVTRVTTAAVTETEAIPFAQIRRPNEYMRRGLEYVEQAGADGSKYVTYEVTYYDGIEASRRATGESIISEPTDEVVVYGSGGIITTPSGELLEFDYKIDGKATAYSCEGQSWRTTYTGTTVHVGTIAVDPDVIPLGTVVYISAPDGHSWVYGTARAEDIGGAVKGNMVDLYMNTFSECMNFGRRSCTIYVLSSN